MPQIFAILFEEKIEDSYIAVMLEGEEPEILFMKGPEFTKTMGPFPLPYAEATFKRWNYCRLKNPPEIVLDRKEDIIGTILHIRRFDGNSAEFCPQVA